MISRSVKARAPKRSAALLRPLLDRIGESRQFDIPELFEDAEMAMRDPTRTDEADAGSRQSAPSIVTILCCGRAKRPGSRKSRAVSSAMRDAVKASRNVPDP